MMLYNTLGPRRHRWHHLPQLELAFMNGVGWYIRHDRFLQVSNEYPNYHWAKYALDEITSAHITGILDK